MMRLATAGARARGTGVGPIRTGPKSQRGDTQIALLNATGAPTDATVRFLRSDGQVTTVPLTLPGIARATINPETLEGLAGASFSTVVESTEPLIADRTMRWGSARVRLARRDEHRVATHAVVPR